MKKLWYAVIDNTQNPDFGYDCGYGSENLDEAIKMAEELDDTDAFIIIMDTTGDDPMPVGKVNKNKFTDKWEVTWEE